MITHVVLFRPRAGNAAGDGQQLADAFERALRDIPSVRRARVGRRITHGRDYELLMKADYQYAALIEFDDVAGLKAYLEHPAHEDLGTRFFAAVEDALVYDFDVTADAAGLAALAGRRDRG